MNQPVKILLVDDDPEFTELTKISLESTGDFSVTCIQESSQAVSKAKELVPDLILLDMIMPGKDGGDVAAEMKNIPELANAPILFLTALVSEMDVSQGAAIITGDGLMLPKTIDPELLIAHIKEQLSLSA